MKKTLITVLAAITVMAMFAGCANLSAPSTTPSASAEPSATVQPTATPTPEETASPEAPAQTEGMFTLKNGSMSIKTPEGWTAADMSSETLSLGIMMSADQKGTIALASVKMPAAPDASVLDQTYDASAAGAVPGGTILSQSDITINGVNGKLFEMTGQSSGQDIHALILVLIKGDILFTATGMAAPADFAAYKDIFTNTLNTLELK